MERSRRPKQREKRERKGPRAIASGCGQERRGGGIRWEEEDRRAEDGSEERRRGRKRQRWRRGRGRRGRSESLRRAKGKPMASPIILLLYFFLGAGRKLFRRGSSLLTCGLSFYFLFFLFFWEGGW